MFASALAVAALTAKMSTTAAAGQKILERQEQIAQERAARERKR
jgi:hypothetical protein